MFDKFTDRARKVMGYARQEAERFNHDYIGTEHVLLGLVKEGSGVAANVLENLDIDLEKLRAEVEKRVKQGPDTGTMGQLPFTQRAKKVLDYAIEEARHLKHKYVGTEHILLGLLREEDGTAAEVLMGLGARLDEVRREVMELLGAETEPGAPPAGAAPKGESKTPALDSFGRDLTELARENKLDPVIGRDREIERVLQILARRRKNNPVLLGEAGVGKTAIVEGFAQRVVNNEVPEILQDRRIVVLDLAMMVAGTKYRGQFEERIKAVMNEVRRAKKVILFIDELHTLVGAGGAEGSIDASNVLKPALSRGEVQCIGATTLDEYRKHIEKDAALERRFQTIIIDPPTKDETIKILEGLRPHYESHHHVKITDGALRDSVEISDRYITGRYLPDKAIDVIDESGARVRLSLMSKANSGSREGRLKDLERRKLAAVAAQDFEGAARLRDEAEHLRDRKQEQRGVVDENVVAEVVASMTGIPLARLESQESERLLQMEQDLHKTVVSQNEAISAMARAIRRSRAGLKDPHRPVGSFLFLGPTGVGKTLLAKALAEFLFGEQEALIQIDMSEYMEKFAVSRLMGAPPGYVGYEEGGQLTEKVRRRPYSVVLFDEIEKAHNDVFNILLQIMEEGALTDSYGRRVDFRNMVLIMTSNVGAQTIRHQGAMGFRERSEEHSYEAMKKQLMTEMEKEFRPEFINRLDEVVVFHSLNRGDLRHIVDIEYAKVAKRLADKGIELVLSPEAKDVIIEKGYNPDFGARPLRRQVERLLEDPLSEEILHCNLTGPCKIRIKPSKDKDKLVFVPIEEPVKRPASPQGAGTGGGSGLPEAGSAG